MRVTGVILVCSLMVALSVREASAVTGEQRCEAYQLAASGQRISAKLHCRAWAKLSGTEVDPSCLDKAEKRFLLQLQDGGAGCATPDDVVSLGAAADAQANAVVADLEPDSPTIPNLTGKWRTRTTVGINPDGEVTLDCDYYKPRPCPDPGMFAIIACDTTLDQKGTSLSYQSTCSTTPESGAQFPPFTQVATGSVDPVTGEWLLSGTVEVAGLPPIFYQGEGVFAADGKSETGFTTAGYGNGADQSLWLATTTGTRLD